MIVHVFNSSIVSGPETLVLPALRHLSEPVTVVFLCESRLPEGSRAVVEYARGLGHDVREVEVKGRWDRSAFARLRQCLDELSPRIVHAHDVKASLYVAQAKSRRSGLNSALVSTHHGAAYRKGKIRLYEELYVRAFLPRFDLALCVCEADRRSISRRGVPEGRIALHLNGTDRRSVSPSERDRVQREIRRKWKSLAPDLPDSDRAIFLGAVARLSPEKRHDRMIRILSEVFHRRHLPREPVLLAFGAGPEEARLRKLAHELGIEKNVFWMGYSKSVGEEMAGFDLLLSLSDGEGIPLNLLEAGWAGTPVLATAVGGIPDVLNSPEVGFLVDRRMNDSAIADELARVFADPDRLRRVATAYQTRVEKNFSQSAWLSRLEQLYRRFGEIRALRGDAEEKFRWS